MGKLTDILLNGDAARLRSTWDQTEAATDFAPLPTAEYIAHVIAGELATTKRKGTPAYKLTFKVAEGDYTGRRFWHDCWLTPPAMPQTKRDLLKLGMQSLDQLERPLPKGIRCRVRLALRKDDDGTEFNRVRSFDVVGIDAPEPEPFAPTDDAGTAESAEGRSDPDSP
jgi:hypothetical protein